MWKKASGGGGGGGTETETTLWTNPNPTSTFARQDVTLFDSYTNYKKICFYYKAHSTLSSESTVKYDKAEIDKWCLSAGQNYAGGIGAYYSYRLTFRTVLRHSTDTTKFSFGHCYQNGYSTEQNDYCIPTKITGIN